MEPLSEKMIAEKSFFGAVGSKGSGLYGFKCLLISSCQCPDVAWAEQHEDERLKDYVNDEWWQVMILGGETYGGCFTHVPGSLLVVIRKPSYEDLMSLVEYANAHGRRTLASLFPELVSAAKEVLINRLLEQGAHET